MKKFLIFFTILFSLYTATWFITANIVERKVQEKITKFQSDGIINSYSGNFEITGYPFRFAVSLDYPSFSFTPKDHKGHYNFLYDGNIDVILGLFSNSIKIKTSGDFHLKGHTNNYPFHIVSSGNKNQYRIQTNDFLISPSLISNISENKDDLNKMLFTVLKRLRIELSNISVINKLNNGLIFSMDRGDTDIRTSYDTKYNINYIENASNALFGRESIILWDNIKTIPLLNNLIQDIPLNIRNYFEAFKLNEFGTINYDANIKISTDSENYLKIDVDSFSMHDNIEKIDVSGTIFLDKDQKKIDLDTNMEFTDRWYQLMRTYFKSVNFRNINLNIFGGASKSSILSIIFSPINHFVDGIFSNRSSRVKQNYVPRLHELGKIKSQINLHHDINTDGSFSLDLDSFNLSTNQYSVYAHGNMKNKNKADKYNFEINLNSYPRLVDITTNYINRLSQSANYNFLLLGSSFNISDNTSKTVKGLIQKLSENPEGSTDNAKIKIKKPQDEKYPEVGKYSSKELAHIWNQFLSQLVFESVHNLVQDITKTLKTKENPEKPTDSLLPQDLLGRLFKKIIK